MIRHRSYPAVVALALLAVSLGPHRAVLAQQAAGASEEARQRARAHNARAKKLFTMGKFKQAAEQYLKAYEAKQVPVFLYNMGQCHKRLGTEAGLRKAIFYYKGYLRSDPADRARVEADLSRLEGQIARIGRQRPTPASKPAPAGKPSPKRLPLVPATAPAPGPASATAPVSTPVYKRWWFWAIVGVAVVGGGVAAGVAASGGDDRVPIGTEIHSSSFSLSGRF